MSRLRSGGTIRRGERLGAALGWVRRLKVILDQTLWVDLVNLSDTNAGTPADDLPAWQDRLGDIETEEGTVTLLLQRVPREGDGVRIWKIAASTVNQIPELYAEFEPAWLEEWLPPFFFEHRVLDVALWKWLVLSVLLAVASLVSLLVAGRTTQLLGVLFTREHESFDPRIVHLVQGPVRLALTMILFAVGHRSLGLALTFAGTLQFLETLLLVAAVAWLFLRLIDLGALALRSTRVRTLERTLVTVPNSEFSSMQLDNFAVRDRRLFKPRLQLRYETTPEQMRYVLAKLRELLLGHPKVDPDPARVRFVGYGSYSKDMEVFAYLRCQEQNDFLAIQEDILLRMEDIIDEAGTGFAYPSQTAYLAQDAGLDTERGAEAEAQVEVWRAGGKLPFPEFEGEERAQLENTLDYPPKGSPGQTPLG